jgi:hypothetical protein
MARRLRLPRRGPSSASLDKRGTNRLIADARRDSFIKSPI